MLNLLIIDNNSNSRKLLLNYISQNNPQIRVFSVVDNIEEGIKILNWGIIDIVLINLNCETNTIMESLKMVSNTYIEKYKKSFIIISNTSENLPNSNFVYTYMSFPTESSVIISKLYKLTEYKLTLNQTSDLLNSINKELVYLGYNLSYSGTKYLAECIALMFNNDDYENLTKDIYPIIAKRYHKNINNIKCNITKATDNMFYECNEERLKSYFNFYTICKPKTKLVICTIINNLHKIR